MPLLRQYNSRFGTRYRIDISTREHLEPKLPARCAEMFKRFTVLANKSGLYPLDWQRFNQLVSQCRVKSRLCWSDCRPRKDSAPSTRKRLRRYMHLYDFKKVT